MSRRAIVNATAAKKRDTMTTYTNTNSVGASSAINHSALIVAGNTGYEGFWVPTARPQGTVVSGALRNAAQSYAVGLAENIRIQTSSPLPWLWRRVCFAFRGPSLYTYATGDSPTNSSPPYSLQTGSVGLVRLWFNQNVNAASNSLNNWESYIFRGAKGVDWDDKITAPLDRATIDVKYDRTTTIRSGNQNGTILSTKRWHPMRKYIRYNDDESGQGSTSSYYSVEDRRGMGDYYIMDIIVPGTGGQASDLMQVQSDATYYWHDRAGDFP